MKKQAFTIRLGLSLLLVYNLLGCGDTIVRAPVAEPAAEVGIDGEDGADGVDGVDGVDGMDGVDGDIVLLAGRTYGPSSWQDDERESAVSGEYELPDMLLAVRGNAGTGWVSLIIHDTKYCYQGVSANSSIRSERFELIGKHLDKSKECFQSGRVAASEASVEIKSGDDLSLSVNGGGCGSNCETTIVQAVFGRKE